jgi:hypothetical protein
MKVYDEKFYVDNAAEPIFGVQVGPALLNVHRKEDCLGPYCVIHNPSQHHMRNWALNWRSDRKMMERLCPEHGTGHPDPDDLAYKQRIGDDDAGVHGCCGCCVPPVTP